jgi:dihydroorotate dehydrogenase (NAD+) catalytic subunit
MSTKPVSLGVELGALHLKNPIMTASGTSGYSDELSAYGSLDQLGAIVSKSLAHFAHDGNPAPRVVGSSGGMLNSVGLQGKGLGDFLGAPMNRLQSSGATVIVSIWGRTVDDYEKAADLLCGVEGIGAVEINMSCPNTDAHDALFAHSTVDAKHVVSAVNLPGIATFAKLSPNASNMVTVAGAVLEAGATGLTLTNTLFGVELRSDASFSLGNGSGGLSGRGLHPVALRAVALCKGAFPSTPIIGAGGVDSLKSALDFLFLGATAVQIGTALFCQPALPWKIVDSLRRWCERHGINAREELYDYGKAHAHGNVR